MQLTMQVDAPPQDLLPYPRFKELVKTTLVPLEPHVEAVDVYVESRGTPATRQVVCVISGRLRNGQPTTVTRVHESLIDSLQEALLAFKRDVVRAGTFSGLHLVR